MAGFETLNKSIVSLRQQGEPTSEECQLDDLPDDELADPGEVDADSSEYSRLAKNYASADLVGPEMHVDLAKIVDNLLSKKQDDASLKQRAKQYLRLANCVLRSAPSEQGNLWPAFITLLTSLEKHVFANSCCKPFYLLICNTSPPNLTPDDA